MASKKRGQFWTQKADCSFKFKETARTLKIYFEKVSDRGNKTIVGTIAIVKQVVFWPAKSRLDFEFKTRNRKYAIIAFRCDNSL